MENTPLHFQGKDAIGHVAETQAKGILTSAEIHGTEIPGHISAGTDAARDTSIILLLVWLICFKSLPLMAIFLTAWLVWKCGRSAWLGWLRLERMHRVVEQERWEIKHHRKQERNELRELYGAKGFEGKLLEDVCDVLMADDERLLKVMVEEELNLRVETYEHPLKQAFGAAVGVAIAGGFSLLCFTIWGALGMWLSTITTILISSALTAYYEGNKMISAIVWNLGIACLTASVVYFLLDYLG